jgi:hypothetical protein
VQGNVRLFRSGSFEHKGLTTALRTNGQKVDISSSAPIYASGRNWRTGELNVPAENRLDAEMTREEAAFLQVAVLRGDTLVPPARSTGDRVANFIEAAR